MNVQRPWTRDDETEWPEAAQWIKEQLQRTPGDPGWALLALLATEEGRGLVVAECCAAGAGAAIPPGASRDGRLDLVEAVLAATPRTSWFP